eukprot:ANDGO_04005.mRNA.1 RNA polymerase II transcription factor B subunit 4
MNLEEKLEEKRAELRRKAELASATAVSAEGSLLILILDSWAIGTPEVIEALLPFLSAFLTGASSNVVAVMYGSEFVCMSQPVLQNSVETIRSVRQEFKRSCEKFASKTRRNGQAAAQPLNHTSSNHIGGIVISGDAASCAMPVSEVRREGARYSAALSCALCFINKFQRRSAASGARPPLVRCFVLCAPVELSMHAIPVMNAVFSCQKMEIPIDCLVVGDSHSVVLQQAAHVSGGIYMNRSFATADSIIQLLLSVYLCERDCRPYILLPKPTEVDFRAACFCHGLPREQGYVCSVCLSVFCSRVSKCDTCGAVFG